MQSPETVTLRFLLFAKYPSSRKAASRPIYARAKGKNLKTIEIVHELSFCPGHTELIGSNDRNTRFNYFHLDLAGPSTIDDLNSSSYVLAVR